MKEVVTIQQKIETLDARFAKEKASLDASFESVERLRAQSVRFGTIEQQEQLRHRVAKLDVRYEQLQTRFMELSQLREELDFLCECSTVLGASIDQNRLRQLNQKLDRLRPTPMPLLKEFPGLIRASLAGLFENSEPTWLRRLSYTHPLNGAFVVTLEQAIGTAYCVHSDRSSIIGRSSSADIRVEDASVSRHHAAVLETRFGLHVRDLRSTNGVRNEAGQLGLQYVSHLGVFYLGQIRFKYFGPGTSFQLAADALTETTTE